LRATKTFVQAHYDYNTIRQADPVFGAIQELIQQLPGNAKVEVSPIVWKRDRVKARYALYPIEIDEESGSNWNYFVDLEGGTFEQVQTPLEVHRLTSGVKVFVKPGNKLISQLSSVPNRSIFGSIQTFLLLTIANMIAGLGLLVFLKISKKETGLLWYLGSAYMLGFLVVTGVTWLSMLAGLSFERKNIFIITIAVPSILILMNLKLFSRKLKDISRLRETLFRLSWNSYLSLFVLMPLIVIIAIVLAASLGPVTTWDAMAHWIMKSKVIFHKKGLIFNSTHHNEYPILWPLNIAMQFCLAGGWHDELAKWTSAAVLLGFVSQLIGCFRFFRMDNKWTCFFLLFYFGCFFHISMTWAYAENSFLAYFTGCLAWVLVWTRNSHKKNYIIVAVLMALGLALVKFEGGVASVILGISLALSWNRRLISSGAWLLVICLFLAPILPVLWLLWNKSAGFLPEIGHVHAGLSFQKILYVLKQSLLIASRGYIGRGLFFGVLLLALVRFSRSLSKVETFLLLTSLGMVSFSIFGMLGWELYMIQSYAKSAVPRLFLHSTPALIVLLSSLIMNSQKSWDVNLSDHKSS
jgi:hypothetical protein